MSKRFHDTEIWEEDWFIALPRDYRDLWLYMKDTCDHAGIWRPNVTKFNKLFDCAVDIKKAVEFFNKDKVRVIVLKNGKWFLCQFVPFQYGTTLNEKNPMHASILTLLRANEVNLTSIRPQIEVKETSRRPLEEDTTRVKDKDKEKDIINKGIIKGEWPHLKNNKFEKAFRDFLEMRQKVRKAATLRAQELLLKELHKFSLEEAIKMIEQSIVNSWQGIFPLKDAKSGYQNNNKIDKLIEEELGRIATKAMIKKVLQEIPKEIWWKVDQFLRNRYPGSGSQAFTEAERELIFETRDDK